MKILEICDFTKYSNIERFLETQFFYESHKLIYHYLIGVYYDIVYCKIKNVDFGLKEDCYCSLALFEVFMPKLRRLEYKTKKYRNNCS